MATSFYRDARVNLSPVEREKLDRWESTAESASAEGQNVIRNLKAESHLVGAPPQSGSSALQAFLRAIVSRFETVVAKEAFENAKDAYLLQGRVLPLPPPRVHRFRPLDRFGRSVAAANNELSDWRQKRRDYVTELLRNWDTIGREKVSRAMLGAHPVVFVTFAKTGSLVTDRYHLGPEIMDALGVGGQADQDVIGLRYPPPVDTPLKYPTTADGGWNRYFAASKPDDEHGWTRPVSNPDNEGWPEAVHQNRTVDLVTDRPSLYPK